MADAPVRLGAFVKADENGSLLPGTAIAGSAYRGIHTLTKPEDAYKRGADPSFKDAVVVPRSTDFGKPVGESNPYGTIVMGAVYDGDIRVEDYTPKMLLDIDKPVAPPEVSINKEKIASPLVFEEAPENITEDAPEHPKNPVPAPVVQQAIPKAVPIVSKIQVSLSGSFGTFRGKFLEVISSGKLIILVYDPEDSVFVPPSGMEKLTLSWLNATQELYYTGIDFVAGKFSAGFQIYVQTEEDGSQPT